MKVFAVGDTVRLTVKAPRWILEHGVERGKGYRVQRVYNNYLILDKPKCPVELDNDECIIQKKYLMKTASSDGSLEVMEPDPFFVNFTLPVKVTS